MVAITVSGMLLFLFIIMTIVTDFCLEGLYDESRQDTLRLYLQHSHSLCYSRAVIHISCLTGWLVGWLVR